MKAHPIPQKTGGRSMTPRSCAGYIETRFTLVTVILIVGAIVINRFWGDIPTWGKIVAALAGIALLVWGFTAATGPRWPALEDNLPPDKQQDSTKETP
jgi:hypothetical protein